MLQHDFILIDRSGSMASKWDDTIGAVNGYVAGLKQNGVETRVTVATFDLAIEPGTAEERSTFDIIRESVSPNEWTDIDIRETWPRGGTPLNDAIGKIVSLAFAGGIGGVQFDKAAIIVVTDGHENASREYTHEQAKAMLQQCRDRDWAVVMLGADFDNTAQSTSYGVTGGNTASVALGNMTTAMGFASAKRGLYAAAGAQAVSMSYTTAEQEELAKKQ